MENQTVTTTKEKSTLGISLLRICILILCIISLRNTAEGLKGYVFNNNPMIAYSISLVFQIIIAVFSLQWKNIIKIPAIFMFVIAFLASIFFDFIFVVNSTYGVTELDDTVNAVTAEFTVAKKDIQAWLEDLHKTKLDETYNSISKINLSLNSVGEDRFAENWNDYWKKEKKEIKETDYNIYELAEKTAVFNAEIQSPEILSKIEEQINLHANKVVDSKLNEIINSVTLIKPDFITSTEIEKLQEDTEDAKIYLQNLIDCENKYYSDKDITIQSETEVKTSTNEETETKNESDAVKKDENIYEEIFSLSANKLIPQINSYETELKDLDATILPGRDIAWKRQILINQREIYNELSQKRIVACKNAIASLDRYKIVISGIEEDAKYNVGALVSTISSNETIKMEDIDNITSKISQVIFTQKNSEDEENFKELKTKLTEYVPLKNLYILLRNTDFFDLENDNKTYSQSEILETTKSNGKAYFDSLIENLTSLSSLSENTTQINQAITKLINIEDKYLNEKNSIVKGMGHLSFEKNSGSSDIDIKKPGMKLAIFAVVFAICIDLLSLILGTIIQNWQKNSNTSNEEV